MRPGADHRHHPPTGGHHGAVLAPRGTGVENTRAPGADDDLTDSGPTRIVLRRQYNGDGVAVAPP